jgi:hypothetical protein
MELKDKSSSMTGGFRDVCRDVMKKLSEIEKLYRNQWERLMKREHELKRTMLHDGIAALICIGIILLLAGFVKFSEKVMVGGVLLVLYSVIKILFPALCIVILCFFLPGFLRRFYNGMKNYIVMNEAIQTKIKFDNRITFKQEERFLSSKFTDIQGARQAYEKLESDYSGQFSETWDDNMEKVYNQLKEASDFQEYSASGLKQESLFKQAAFTVVIVIAVGIVVMYMLFANAKL